MYDTVVVATDGSDSVERAVTVATDLARRFGADCHGLYVVDTRVFDDAPRHLRPDLRAAVEERSREALAEVEERAAATAADAADGSGTDDPTDGSGADDSADGAGTDGTVTTAVREGRPAEEIVAYAREVDADVLATGTRGRHGEGRIVLGSVAEKVVRTAPMPVLTVRRLAEEE